MSKKFPVLFFLTLAFVSCQPKEDVVIERIRNNYAVANALSAKIRGEFDGFSQKELAYGTVGVLYSVHSEDYLSKFDDWKNGSQFDGSIIKEDKISQDRCVEFVVVGLNENTSYDYCLFFESENGERVIGRSDIFTTKLFTPEISTLDINIRYFDAQVVCNVTGASDDLEQCIVGVAVSDDSTVTIEDDLRMFSWDEGNANGFSAIIKNLNSDSKYYVSPFLLIKESDTYFLGTVTELKTRNVDEMAVDLGLSVKWADCYLGAQSFEEMGAKYAWGMLRSTGKNDLAYYDYYRDGEYVNIGSVISGNEKYDVATAILGGKWRMPTYEEVLELMEKCKYDGEFITENISRNRYVADNGNFIIFTNKTQKIPGGLILGTPIWTGSIDPENPEMAYCFGGISTLRYMECLIRPVMDY